MHEMKIYKNFLLLLISQNLHICLGNDDCRWFAPLTVDVGGFRVEHAEKTFQYQSCVSLQKKGQ